MKVTAGELKRPRLLSGSNVSYNLNWGYGLYAATNAANRPPLVPGAADGKGRHHQRRRLGPFFWPPRSGADDKGAPGRIRWMTSPLSQTDGTILDRPESAYLLNGAAEGNAIRPVRPAICTAVRRSSLVVMAD